MKTLEDLIDKLNETKEDEGIYYSSEKHKGMFTVDYRMDNESWSIAIFDKLNKAILLTTNKSLMNWKEMYWISKYALEHTYKDWFPEKKYNIIIGRDSKKTMYDNQVVTTYRKNGLNDFFVNDNTHNSQLSDYDYQFTESEIEELKSTLPTNMAKIVDLGKVEVKDDSD